MGDQSVTIYAHYTGNVYTNTVYYNQGSGAGGPTSDSKSVTYPTTQCPITLSTVIPTMVGYTFAGWYTDPTAGERITGSVTVGSNEISHDQDVTLYAHYLPNVYSNTIKYNTCGGTGGPNDDSHDVTYPNTSYEHTVSLVVPKKNGHKFLG